VKAFERLKTVKRRPLIISFVAVAVFFILSVTVSRTRLQLGDTRVVTGWSVFLLMIFLALFNARKRLSMIPLGSAHTWLLIHVVGGVLALAFFWLHAESPWPKGLYEQFLAGLFYLISANGIIGYLLQNFYPPRLTQTGIEIVYERIPGEIAEIHEKARNLVTQCTKETGSDTLAKYYLDTLDWFFCRPRFFTSHAVGGQKSSHWIHHQCSTVRRYLDNVESSYLDKLASLADIKDKVDFHYTAQTLMKGWLLFHVPLAAVVMTLSVWHFIIVHIYAL